MLRKIIEIENLNELTPAADWDDFEEFMFQIQHK
jgi:hypothetical protein